MSEIDEIATLAYEVITIKSQESILEDRRKSLESQLKTLVGEGMKVQLPDGTKISVSMAGSRTTFESARFKKELPNVYGKYSHEVPTEPRLTITQPKKEK
jgi:predicted phage-related endonuclease